VQFCWRKRDGSKGTLIGIHLEKLYQRLKCLRISMAPSRDVRNVGESRGNPGEANYPAGKIPWRMPANDESEKWRTFIRWRFHNFSTGLLIGFFFSSWLMFCRFSLSFFSFIRHRMFVSPQWPFTLFRIYYIALIVVLRFYCWRTENACHV